MTTLRDVRHQLDKLLVADHLRARSEGRSVSHACTWAKALQSIAARSAGEPVATVAVPREIAEAMLWHLQELNNRREARIRGDMRDYRLNREAAEERAPKEIDLWGPGLPSRDRTRGNQYMESNLSAILDLNIRRDLKALKQTLRKNRALREKQIDVLQEHYPDLARNITVDEIAARAMLSFVVMDEHGEDVRYGGLNVEDCPVKSWQTVIDRAKRRPKV